MKDKSVKILIVDDNEDLAITISDYFKNYDLGITSLFTSDSAKVMPILEENQDIKLILSDFYMPGMNGIDLLMSVREKYPQMLFVMMTGYHTEDLQDRGLEHGVVRFFKKPFSINELTDFIHESLSDSISGFNGTIDSIQLPDIVQLIAMGHRTAEVELTTDQGSGAIYFRNGEIIHASCDGLDGEEAFYKMFNWVGGQFNVRSLTSSVEQTIEQSWQGLVLEAARRKDEAEAIVKGTLTIEPDQETGYKPKTGFEEVLEEDSTAPDSVEEAAGIEADLTAEEERVEEVADEESDQAVSDYGFLEDIKSTPVKDVIEREDDIESPEIPQIEAEDSAETVEEGIDALSDEPEVEGLKTVDYTVDQNEAPIETTVETDIESVPPLVSEEVLDEKLISEALEQAFEHYIKLWPEGEEKLLASSLPLDSLPEQIQNHFKFRFQRDLMKVIRTDDVPFNFENKDVTGAIQNLLSTLYSTWEVPKTSYMEMLRYALSFELAYSINPARALTEIIQEISGGIASDIKSIVGEMIEFGIIGEHFHSLVEDISQQGSREISSRSIEYLCRSAIYRLDEEKRYDRVRNAMRSITEIAQAGGVSPTNRLHYNVVLNMLEAHGLAQVSDYINMTRDLGDIAMTISDLDDAIEKLRQRSRGMIY